MKKLINLFLLTFSLLTISTVNAQSEIIDLKRCGYVPRTESGDIKRSSTVVRHFQLLNPCPSTGLTTGACPGWSADHVVPLACGGCDSVTNLQWLPVQNKSCGEPYCKDRFERKIQLVDPNMPGLNTRSCGFTVIPSEFFEPKIIFEVVTK